MEREVASPWRKILSLESRCSTNCLLVNVVRVWGSFGIECGGEEGSGEEGVLEVKKDLISDLEYLFMVLVS